MDSEVAVPSCKIWTSPLVDRLQKYQESRDINTLPISNNGLGMALMRIPDQEEAVKSWLMSCEIIPQVAKSGELPLPFPWADGAIDSAHSGDSDIGYDLLLSVLEEREEKLGVDETITLNKSMIKHDLVSVTSGEAFLTHVTRGTGFILSFLSNICCLQGCEGDAFGFYKRGASTLRENVLPSPYKHYTNWHTATSTENTTTKQVSSSVSHLSYSNSN